MTARNASNTALIPPSLTTSTSVTDGSSEPTEESVTSDEQMHVFSPARKGAISSKNTSLARREIRTPRKNGLKVSSRKVSDDTLVDEKGSSRERLLQESVLALDGDWELDAMPGENLQLAPQSDTEVKRVSPARLKILERASSLVEKTKGVLGKRGREMMNTGMEKIQALPEPKRSSLRLQETQTASLDQTSSFEAPVRKRPRFSESESKPTTSHLSTIRRKALTRKNKQWLSQGLYIGQDRDFDARLTESQNKLKKRSIEKQTKPRRANSIMPLPMFAGQRILDLGRPFSLPFDVFSPLPPGQPKPDEWKKTQKSIQLSLSTCGHYTNGLQTFSLATPLVYGKKHDPSNIQPASAAPRQAATKIA